MSRVKYERIIAAVPQEVLDEIRITAEAEALMENIFGKEVSDELE